jgi:adenylate cyclase
MATPDQLEAWERAGLYDPAGPAAADRLAVLEFLAGRDLEITDVMGLAPEVELSWVPFAPLVSPTGSLTLVELAAATGWEVEELAAFLRNCGLPVPRDDQAVFDVQHTAAFAALHQVGQVFSDSVGPKLALVMGTSLGALAEAVVAALLQEIYDSEIDTGRTELERAQFNARAFDTLNESMNALTVLVTLHVQAAAARWLTAVDDVETGSLRAAVGFIDLVGFPQVSRNASLIDLRRLVDRFESVAHEIVADHEGRLVKHIGDAVMFISTTAAQACAIGLDFIERFADSSDRIAPRGGIAMGSLLARQGDYYGPVVNLSARIADQAVPDEILVAEPIPTEGPDDLAFRPAGRRLLKGFDDPVELWSVARRTGR